MVYGYKTNVEFIDKSYQLLEKLEAKGLWNKDTLVIGLDKSVRPLAYSLRKISDLEGKEKPDMRFFNYSSHLSSTDEEINKVVSKIISKQNPRKFWKYRNVLILDDHVWSGNSLKDAKKIFDKYLNEDLSVIPISLGALDKIRSRKSSEEIISVGEGKYGKSSPAEFTGIKDKILEEGVDYNISTPIKDKEIRQKFLENRYQLSKDIKNYLHEKHPEKISKSSSLEKIVKPISIWLFVLGILFSSKTITGNVIGTFQNQNILGAILIVLGIVGFFISRKSF